ncbi:MAG TPA: GGDEF domain-containing protein [Thermoleophilia bacterium]|nr:GGDEF domain-containing protein [Thermoleophilia bacterium]
MSDGIAPQGKTVRSAPSPLFQKVEGVLDAGKVQVTKNWLARIIERIDDLASLEQFPTQESIKTSVELIEGLAAVLSDEDKLSGFEPGGKFYALAAGLGITDGGGARGLVTLSQNMLELENAIWALLAGALRNEDRDLLRLVARLRVAMHGIHTASTEAYFHRSNTELDRLAHTDQLTGLYNRRYMIQELERHGEMYKRYRHPFSVLMLDLDNLKTVNDTLGHPAGDAALKHLAMLLRVNIRDVDIACRYGGDEFVVLMPETEQNVVQIVGDRIAASLAKTKLKLGSNLVSLEVSAGNSSCPADGCEPAELLQVADASLYRSKEARRGTGSAILRDSASAAGSG